MRFHVAWDSLEKENRFLKILVFVILLVSICLCVGLTAASFKEPIVIERACYSHPLDKSQINPTDVEIKAFIAEALQARFNTNLVNPLVLTREQSVFRDKEQTELAKQKMRQTVVVNDVLVEKDGITVDADRLISVGEVRSSFKFPLKAELRSETRSEGNPYGLVLSQVEEIHEVKK